MSIKGAYTLGSFGIALGLLILGYKVMETLGKQVVKLDYPKGFTAQFATAVTVNVGSIIGIPLSTTHCMVGSLIGLIVATKCSSSVKKIYPPEEEEKDTNSCVTGNQESQSPKNNDDDYILQKDEQ